MQEPLVRPEAAPQSPNSRRIVLHYTSKSISGSYPLYDLLSISTESGSISVSVTPQPASSYDPSQPASLELRSKSGSIRATLLERNEEHVDRSDNAVIPSDPPPPYELTDTSSAGCISDAKHDGKENTVDPHSCGIGSHSATSAVPARDYTTAVYTRSGSISGSFPLGINTKIETGSGSLSGLELVVMPTKTSGARRLSTVTQNGSQNIRVVSNGFWAAEKDAWWQGMASLHEGRSGSINIEYPDSWEGGIEIVNESGSVSITGRGVEYIWKGDRKVIAKKGNDTNTSILIKNRSGSVNLRFV
ncbi:hypothetical protein BX600DRAFT_518524 [Xylariales sp. PMI_506]|nr:hypothetical protein BX600DRAFT_518524 [Xylariales sp. PMI_506]